MVLMIDNPIHKIIIQISECFDECGKCSLEMSSRTFNTIKKYILSGDPTEKISSPIKNKDGEIFLFGCPVLLNNYFNDGQISINPSDTTLFLSFSEQI